MCSLPLPSVAELTRMEPSARESLLRSLERARLELEVTVALLVGMIGNERLHADDGHRTAASWGRAACNWSRAEALRMSRLGRLFMLLPNVRDAGLGISQLHALANTAANPRVQHALPAAEELLVAQGRRLDHDDYVVFLAQWAATVDPDGAHTDHAAAHRRRRAHLSIVGTHTYLDAVGGVTDGVTLIEVLDAYTHAEFLADCDTATDGALLRTSQQRRWDALVAIFRAASTGTAAGPVVNLVIDREQFEHTLSRIAGANPPPLKPSTTHRSETIDGTPIDPIEVVLAAMLGRVRRVIVDGAGVVLDLGRKRRLFTGPLRDAILLHHRRCLWPSCDIPTRNCQGDHLTPFAHDGPTAIHNGAPVCGHHNRWRTRGYTTHRDQHGHWHHHRPDGTTIGWRAALPHADTG